MRRYKMELKGFLNLDTGEVFSPESYSISIKRIDEVNDSSAYSENLNNMKDFIKRSDNPFYYFNYEKMIEDGITDYHAVFKFLTLAVFGDYKNNIKARNLNNVFLTRDQTTIANMKRIKELNLVDKDGKINTRYVLRGRPFRNNQFIKVFNKGVKELYKAADKRQYMTLGKLILLLPHLSNEDNYFKTEMDVPLTENDICEIIGLGSTNHEIFRRTFLRTMINDLPLIIETPKGFLLNPGFATKITDVNKIIDTERVVKDGKVNR